MEWIKVTDRKPEDLERVHVTCLLIYEDGHVERIVDEATYFEDSDSFEAYGYDGFYDELEGVIAWMSFPEAYAGD